MVYVHHEVYRMNIAPYLHNYQNIDKFCFILWTSDVKIVSNASVKSHVYCICLDMGDYIIVFFQLQKNESENDYPTDTNISLVVYP